MTRLAGRVAVVTGGASGIGEATVRLFCSQGARCVIADIQDARGQQLVLELEGAAVYQRTDVSREEDVQAAVQRALSEFGRLDCMFNNAGLMGATGPIQDIPVDEFDRTLGVLLRGPFLGIKHAVPVMKAQGGGSIISTASIAGIMGGIGPHIYATAKAAVIQLSKSAALEVAEFGIRVNTICPGVIGTPLLTATMSPPGTSDEQAKAMLNDGLKMYQPVRRAGAPNDIASCALWLASDESTFVTGQSLVVDGGATAGLQWAQQPEIFRVYAPMY